MTGAGQGRRGTGAGETKRALNKQLPTKLPLSALARRPSSPVVLSADGNSMLLRASAKRLFESLMEQTADRIYIKDKKSRFIGLL